MDGLKLPADLDVLLRQTMAEAPSVEFLPRVRERVASEQVCPRPSWRPLFAGAGMLAVAMIAMVASGTRDVIAPSPPPAPRPASGMTDMQMPRVSPPTALSLEIPAAAPRRVRPSAVTYALDDMPPVIVDTRQRSAIGRMVSLAVQGRLPEDALLPSPSLQPIEERLGELAVRPVEVSPIALGGVLQSGPDAKQPPRPAEASFRP